MIAEISKYFAETDAIPVETRLLQSHGVTDPSVNNLTAQNEQGELAGYLQFSPEFAMKALVADGAGDIYQITRAFRGGEEGRLHRSEFRMLEWYRLGYDHHQLMDDVQALIEPLVSDRNWWRRSYAEVFRAHVGVDPHRASNDFLFTRASTSVELEAAAIHDRALLFDVIFSHQIQPEFGAGEAIFIFDFPKEQAAYAQIRHEEDYVASRFELLIDGVEIANGYHEVTDPVEQAKRHAQERARRESAGQQDIDFDPAFISALGRGLPACAGVAVGLDRLIMTIFGADSLQAVEMR